MSGEAGAAESAVVVAKFGVVVTGFKRSGTSLMMEILRRAGFAPWFDTRFERFLVDEYPAGKAAGGTNEYFFEDPQVVHTGCNDALIAHLCSRQCSCKVFAYGINEELRQAARTGQVRVVMMRRAHDSIRSSISTYKGDGAVEGHRTAAADFAALEQLDLDGLAADLGALQVRYEELVASPQQQVERLVHFLSLPVDGPALPARDGECGGSAGSGIDQAETETAGMPMLLPVSGFVQQMADAVKPALRHH